MSHESEYLYKDRRYNKDVYTYSQLLELWEWYLDDELMTESLDFEGWVDMNFTLIHE